LLMVPVYAAARMIYQAYGVIAGKGAAGEFARQYSPLELLGILIKAHLAALAGAPMMWRKRLKINRMKKVSNREFYCWLKRFRLSAKELALKE